MSTPCGRLPPSFFGVISGGLGQTASILNLAATNTSVRAFKHAKPAYRLRAGCELFFSILLTNGSVDDDKYTIGGLIHRAKASMSNGHLGKVRVFGEMVSQLRNTDVTATTRLEELWNEVIEEHSVALLCTYAMHDADDHIPASLIALHSHNIERESSVAQNA